MKRTARQDGLPWGAKLAADHFGRIRLGCRGSLQGDEGSVQGVPPKQSAAVRPSALEPERKTGGDLANRGEHVVGRPPPLAGHVLHGCSPSLEPGLAGDRPRRPPQLSLLAASRGGICSGTRAPSRLAGVGPLRPPSAVLITGSWLLAAAFVRYVRAFACSTVGHTFSVLPNTCSPRYTTCPACPQHLPRRVRANRALTARAAPPACTGADPEVIALGRLSEDPLNRASMPTRVTPRSSSPTPGPGAARFAWCRTRPPPPAFRRHHSAPGTDPRGARPNASREGHAPIRRLGVCRASAWRHAFVSASASSVVPAMRRRLPLYPSRVTRRRRFPASWT